MGGALLVGGGSGQSDKMSCGIVVHPPAPIHSPSLHGRLWDAAAAAEVCHGLIALRPAPLFTGGNAEGVQVANMHTKIKGGTCAKKGCTLTWKKNTRHHSHDSPITK